MLELVVEGIQVEQGCVYAINELSGSLLLSYRLHFCCLFVALLLVFDELSFVIEAKIQRIIVSDVLADVEPSDKLAICIHVLLGNGRELLRVDVLLELVLVLVEVVIFELQLIERCVGLQLLLLKDGELIFALQLLDLLGHGHSLSHVVQLKLIEAVAGTVDFAGHDHLTRQLGHLRR